MCHTRELAFQIKNEYARFSKYLPDVKTAVFYEVLVRAFRDSNGDGTGDLRGLVEKLDYLQWLGVDCLWIPPFFPRTLTVAILPYLVGLPPAFKDDRYPQKHSTTASATEIDCQCW